MWRNLCSRRAQRPGEAATPLTSAASAPAETPSSPSASPIERQPSPDELLDMTVLQVQTLCKRLINEHQACIRSKKVDPTNYRKSEVAIKKCSEQLSRAHRQMVRRTWHTGEAEQFLNMYNGKDGGKCDSFTDAARRVLLVNRVARVWRERASSNVMKKTNSEETGRRAMQLGLDSWDEIDIFQLDSDTGHPLATAFMAVWERRRISKICKMSSVKVQELLHAVELQYKQNPYHNQIHAADVLLAAWYLWSGLTNCSGMQHHYTEIDLLVMLFAAAVHDIGHPGLNNEFLTKTRHSLALRYNDISPLENFHAATAFELMKDKGVDLLDHRLPSPPVQALRKRVIEMILATDMAKHEEKLERFSAMSTGTLHDMDKTVLEKHLLHVADLSHPLRPYSLHRQWSERCTTEFFSQGDQERELGFEPVSLYDREKAPPLAKGQLGFLKFIVIPAWKPLQNIAKDAIEVPERFLSENLARWEKLAEQSS